MKFEVVDEETSVVDVVEEDWSEPALVSESVVASVDSVDKFHQVPHVQSLSNLSKEVSREHGQDEFENYSTKPGRTQT